MSGYPSELEAMSPCRRRPQDSSMKCSPNSKPRPLSGCRVVSAGQGSSAKAKVKAVRGLHLAWCAFCSPHPRGWADIVGGRAGTSPPRVGCSAQADPRPMPRSAGWTWSLRLTGWEMVWVWL